MHIQKPKTDLRFNVAQLLREEVGASRSYTFAEAELPLDDDLSIVDLRGSVRFTRTASGVLADARATGTAPMECIRCLAPAPQQIAIQFRDEFHSRIDVNTGVPLPKPDEDDPFFISETHLLDLGEALREYALIELPMQPLCRADCKGLCPICGVDRNVETCGHQDEGGDERMGALRSLLE